MEEAFNRIKTHKGIKGILIVNTEGVPVRSTMNPEETLKYSGLISNLTNKASSVIKELDKTNELMFLRVRSKLHEVMVAPDREFMLVVIQNPDEA